MKANSKLKVLFFIHRLAVNSQTKLDVMLKEGATFNDILIEGMRMMAYSRCWCRLFKKYDSIIGRF